jgi:biopolymer transport protein ExbD
MSRGGGHGGKLGHGGPNMTPMVDVVMCILIFFMLGSSFATPELYLTSNTPTSPTGGLSDTAVSDKLPPVTKRIQLQRLGDETIAKAFDAAATSDLVTLSADPNSTASLPDLLRVKQPLMSKDVQIIIAPEPHVPYKDVLAAYDACVNAHFEHVAFAPVSTH